LDQALEQVLAGTYDPEVTIKRQKKEESLEQLLANGQMEKALKVVDELIALSGKVFEYYQLKLTLMAEVGKAQAVKELYQEMFTSFADSEEDMNTLAWIACTASFKMCDLEVALKAARRAVELSGRNNPPVLDTLARVYYALGALDDAIAVQKEAIEKCADAAEKEDLEETLSYYKKAQALRETLGDGKQK
jgi:tetratricopeptide (TPR) repeat protein